MGNKRNWKISQGSDIFSLSETEWDDSRAWSAGIDIYRQFRRDMQGSKRVG